MVIRWRCTGRSGSGRAGRAAGAVAGLLAAVVLAAGCGSSAGAPAGQNGAGAGRPAATHGTGPVDVLYAGSLLDLMEKQIGPGFKQATGYSLEGFAGGSNALASQVKGGIRQGDVFISANPSVNAELQGAANGGWVSWYAQFATSPLVIGYNPSSRLGKDLRAKPWYQALAEPGILVGRTDPATDPKGKLTVDALKAAAQQYATPALGTIATAISDVYPEETLVGRLQAGQLDAGFFYSSEAAAASIPSVPVTVPGQTFQATYTVTVLARAPHLQGAESFVRYLLGPDGQAALRKDGFTLVRPPTVSGGGVPAGLGGVVPAG